MEKKVLKNGITVIIEPRETATVALQATIKTGSNNESKKIKGISHIIEHMLFEGTKNRSPLQISGEIEGLGGEIGAFTTNERTCFYVKSLPHHFDKSLEILADIIQNPLFSKKSLEKEKKIIISEVKLMHDEPRFYQWELFQKTLFKKHPARTPIIGTKKAIRSISRQDILDYYNRYYVPNNIIVSVVGKVKDILPTLEESFSDFKGKKLPTSPFVSEPEKKAPEEMMEKRHIHQSYLVFGYKTVPRAHQDSYTLDVIRAILGKGLSGRLFTEIRTKRGLAYDVGVHHEVNINYGFFAVYLSTDKKNINECKNIILNELKKLNNVKEKELEEAKNFIEGDFLMSNEDNQKFADTLAYWDFARDVSFTKSYLNNIIKVTKKDILTVAKRYFTPNYTIAILKQK
jgi:zinc protease